MSQPDYAKRGFAKGDPRAREQGRKGGLVRGEQRKRESVQHWCLKYPGVSPEAAREIYTHGFNSGYAAGARHREARP